MSQTHNQNLSVVAYSVALKEENASRPDQRILEATLDTLPHILEKSNVTGPALTLYGLAPRATEADLITITLQEFA